MKRSGYLCGEQDTRRIYTGYAIGIGEGNGAVFKETYDRKCYLGQ